eukprot:7205835-Heterocapsa_arctica.AAC.1
MEKNQVEETVTLKKKTTSTTSSSIFQKSAVQSNYATSDGSWREHRGGKLWAEWGGSSLHTA